MVSISVGVCLGVAIRLCLRIEGVNLGRLRKLSSLCISSPPPLLPSPPLLLPKMDWGISPSGACVSGGGGGGGDGGSSVVVAVGGFTVVFSGSVPS